MTTDGKEDKDSVGTEEKTRTSVSSLMEYKGEGLAAPPATTQTPTSMTHFSLEPSRDQTTTGKGGEKEKNEKDVTTTNTERTKHKSVIRWRRRD